MKHLRRRFPTVWAARHCSPGRTMMQNGPSDVAKRAISQCQTAHIAVSDGPFCSAWRAQGPDGWRVWRPCGCIFAGRPGRGGLAWPMATRPGGALPGS